MQALIKKIALILLIVGGVNWTLHAFAGMNLVEIIFGHAVLAKIIYLLIGLSALLYLPELVKKD